MTTIQHLEGHLNTQIPDQKSYVTGYGKHARVIATIPDVNGLYCRIDLKWGLRIPTEKEVLKVAKHYGDAKGKWKLKTWESYYSNGLDRIDVYFEKA
jgi:hypothetical protein